MKDNVNEQAAKALFTSETFHSGLVQIINDRRGLASTMTRKGLKLAIYDRCLQCLIFDFHGHKIDNVKAKVNAIIKEFENHFSAFRCRCTSVKNIKGSIYFAHSGRNHLIPHGFVLINLAQGSIQIGPATSGEDWNHG